MTREQTRSTREHDLQRGPPSFEVRHWVPGANACVCVCVGVGIYVGGGGCVRAREKNARYLSSCRSCSSARCATTAVRAFSAPAGGNPKLWGGRFTKDTNVAIKARAAGGGGGGGHVI